MSPAAVADTHAALWYLYSDPRLSVRAREFIEASIESGDKIALSSISLVEIVYLVERRRIPVSAYQDMVSVLDDPDSIFEEVAVSKPIADAVRNVPRPEIPDMPDRIIAATGSYFGVPVLSRDRRILASSIETIW